MPVRVLGGVGTLYVYALYSVFLDSNKYWYLKVTSKHRRALILFETNIADEHFDLLFSFAKACSLKKATSVQKKNDVKNVWFKKVL